MINKEENTWLYYVIHCIFRSVFVYTSISSPGDVSAYYTPNATVVIAANDKANGVFKFVAPFTQSTAEGSAAEFE